MEISKSVQEVLTQAQMLKLNTNSSTLCVEHFLYALLLMAKYLDEPMNKKEYLTEAKKLRKMLEKQINSIAMAEQELRVKAYQDPAAFHNDPSVLGRAVEIAGAKAVSTLDLANAVLEKSESTVSWLNSLDISPAAAEDDARYGTKKPAKQKPPQQNPIPSPNNDTMFSISGTDQDPSQTIVEPEPNQTIIEPEPNQTIAEPEPNLDEMRKLFDEERKRFEKDKKQLAAERKQFSEEHRQFEEDRKKFEEERKIFEEEQDVFFDRQERLNIDREQLRNDRERLEKDREALDERENHLDDYRIHLEREKAKLNELQAQQPKQAPKKQKDLWTFIGPFKFRGSAFWGFLQYFLLGALVSCGALFALEHFTHYVTKPPTAWWSFGINVFIVVSVYYHLRGITYLMERKWPAWALFTRQIFDILLILALMSVYVFEFCVPGYFPKWREYVTGRFLTFKPSPLPFVPRWLKYVGGVFCVLVFSVGSIIYNSLHYVPEDEKKKIKYGSNEGPVGKVILQSVSGNLAFPVALLFAIWAYDKPFKPWQIKVFWIYGFLALWTMFFTIFSCWHQAVHAKWYRGKMFNIVRFIFRLHISLFIPELVLFLHWLFGWSPMQLWVKIILCVYTVIAVIMSAVGAWLLVRK